VLGELGLNSIPDMDRIPLGLNEKGYVSKRSLLSVRGVCCQAAPIQSVRGVCCQAASIQSVRGVCCQTASSSMARMRSGESVEGPPYASKYLTIQWLITRYRVPSVKVPFFQLEIVLYHCDVNFVFRC
jgi:hypothetical protein